MQDNWNKILRILNYKKYNGVHKFYSSTGKWAYITQGRNRTEVNENSCTDCLVKLLNKNATVTAMAKK